MRLEIRCIGQNNDSALNQEITKFSERLSHPFQANIKIYPHSKSKNISVQKSEEAQLLLSNIPKNSLLIATAIKGKNYSTEGLFQLIKTEQQAVIFIGGCNGLDASVTKICQHTWSLSNLTLPHTLVRLIVIEQWYRLNCIFKNHPYHK